MPAIITRGAASAKAFGWTNGGVAPPGQQAYTTAGTYSWVAPAGVTKVSLVAVGGGGGALEYITGMACCCPTYSYRLGGGGGLGYTNNHTVIPANSYTVVVGVGGAGRCNTYCSPAPSGGNSYFVSTATVKGRRIVTGKL